MPRPCEMACMWSVRGWLRLVRSYCNPLRTVLYSLCVNQKIEFALPNICFLSATFMPLVYIRFHLIAELISYLDMWCFHFIISPFSTAVESDLNL